MKYPWTLTKVRDEVTRLTFTDIRAGWEGWVLLSSDRHHDNLLADWTLEKLHLDMARERKAPIIDAGDLFCAMQGKYDPRRDYDGIRPEHRTNNYLDALIDTAVDFYRPYSDLFAVIGTGNHETKVLDRHGVNLTDRLVRGLKGVNPTAPVQAGGYGGWVWFNFEIRGTNRQSVRLKYFHGAGGGGASSRGTLDINRIGITAPDADIVLMGHTHDAYLVPITQERITQTGNLYKSLSWHVRTPGYKDEYQDGSSGWWVETGKPPKPRGAAWLRFKLEGDRISTQAILDVR